MALPEIENTDLFEALRELRKKLATQEMLPPYIILSDKVLFIALFGALQFLTILIIDIIYKYKYLLCKYKLLFWMRLITIIIVTALLYKLFNNAFIVLGESLHATQPEAPTAMGHTYSMWGSGERSLYLYGWCGREVRTCGSPPVQDRYSCASAGKCDSNRC